MPGPFAGAGGIVFGLLLLAVSLGLQASLLGARAEIEGFPTEVAGLIMSGYAVGCLLGTAFIPRLLRRLGHGQVFAVLTSLATCGLLAQASFAHPAVWGAMRVLVGFGFGGLLLVGEHWLSEHAPGRARSRALSFYMIANMLALAGGQALLLVADPSDHELFILAAALTSFALVPILGAAKRTPRDTPPLYVGVWPLFRGSPLGCITALGAGLGFGAVFWMGAFYGSLVPFSKIEICWLLGSFLIGGLIGQWPASRAVRYLDRRIVIAAISFLAALAAFGAIIISFFSKAGFFLIIGLIGALSLPLLSLSLAHTRDRMGDDEPFAIGGSLSLVFLIGSGLGALASGFAMSPRLIGDPGLFLFLTFVHLLVGTYALFRMARREGIAPAQQSRSALLSPATSASAIGASALAQSRGNANR